jgi:hypothetical protein
MILRLTGSGCLAAALMLSPVPSDQGDIRSARARSNRAIAAHDVDAAALIWSEDYVGVSSRNDHAVGRNEERSQLAGIFASRPEVVFVRTPTSITVNAKWGQAGENGRWTGRWSGPEGITRVSGIYFAKWRREESTWRILAETFVQTSCSGTSYCDTPPGLSR